MSKNHSTRYPRVKALNLFYSVAFSGLTATYSDFLDILLSMDISYIASVLFFNHSFSCSFNFGARLSYTR